MNRRYTRITYDISRRGEQSTETDVTTEEIQREGGDVVENIDEGLRSNYEEITESEHISGRLR